jgi:hypothetical protein
VRALAALAARRTRVPVPRRENLHRVRDHDRLLEVLDLSFAALQKFRPPVLHVECHTAVCIHVRRIRRRKSRLRGRRDWGGDGNRQDRRRPRFSSTKSHAQREKSEDSYDDEWNDDCHD